MTPVIVEDALAAACAYAKRFRCARIESCDHVFTVIHEHGSRSFRDAEPEVVITSRLMADDTPPLRQSVGSCAHCGMNVPVHHSLCGICRMIEDR